MTVKVQWHCGNCGGPEVHVPTTLVIRQTVLDLQLCATCYLRLCEIRAAREDVAIRVDLNQLYVETHMKPR